MADKLPAKKPRPAPKKPGEVPSAKAEPALKTATLAAAVPKSVAASKPQAGAIAGSEEDVGEEEASGFQDFLRESPSWLTSLVVHMVLLLMLAMWVLPTPVPDVLTKLNINPFDTEQEELEEISEEIIEDIQVDVGEVSDVMPQPEAQVIEEEVNFSPAEDLEAAAVHIDLADLASETAPRNELMNTIGASTGKGLDGRGHKARTNLVRQGGGTAGSERAVGLALKWLAEHQNPDGSWSLDHRGNACQGRCSKHGEKESNNGATALALLPYLGAGQTHMEGNYKKNVRAGLYYLVRKMQPVAGGAAGSLHDKGGTMYAHGLASIALCEAYAMTQDKGLARPAQAGLNFIAYAQDPRGGGWRYKPRQPGDTSAVGWQIMALKSGHMAYLSVPQGTIKGAWKFLDSVQTDGGSAYGYVDPGNGNGTSAVGLLCRMYMGWKNDNSALGRGVARFAKSGPSPTNFYYNYYATQVMFQFHNGEGPVWKKWNDKMRDQLVNSQAHQGHEEGSWHAGKDHSAKAGGRLYCTAMATMILEVYYRHMPIYQQAATAEEFPD